MADDAKINLNELTQRELLILTAKQQQELKAEVEELKKGQQHIALDVNSLKTRARISGGVMGFITGLGTVLIERLINR